jgi:hypothetical protein
MNINLETGKTPADKDVRRFLNWSKNTVEHMDDGNPNIWLNPISEARYWIENAIINHDKIGFPKSSIMRKYEDCRNREMEREYGLLASTKGTTQLASDCS